MSDNAIKVKIRPVRDLEECTVVGDIYQQACSQLKWHKHVNVDVKPEVMKKNISRLANVVRKQYHGIVILAELDDKVVGYLMAWEEGPGSADPYRHKSVKSDLPGRRMPIWWSLYQQIDKVFADVQEKNGPFLYVDEMAVLPEYQGFGIGRKLLDYATKGAGVYNLPIVLVAALEALRFYEKLHFEPCGQVVKLVGDDKAQLVPMVKKIEPSN